MSLRLKISLFISVGTVLVLCCALLVIVINARSAVEKEINSTAQLSLDLLETVFSSLPRDSAHYQNALHHLQSMEKRRHLSIHLQHIDSQETLEYSKTFSTSPEVPAWFTQLVAPQTRVFRRSLTSAPFTQATDIILQTDPSDEIEEAWQESSDLLMLLLSFALSLIVLLYIGLGIALRPLNQLQKALDAIGRRQYHTSLPMFHLAEFDNLAQQFNAMAQQLQQVHKENQRLLQESLSLQEEERRVIARELHDELGQCLSAIKADAFSMISPEQNPAINASARAIADTASYVYGLVKDMIRRLRPAALDELGLIAALQQTLAEWQSRYPQTQVDFHTKGDFSQLNAAFSIHLYRIIQEGLTNVAKHAAAQHLSIELIYKTQEIDLKISDDGEGFDVTSPHQGLGLLGIRERVEALNGHLEIHSRPQQGTIVKLQLPLQK